MIIYFPITLLQITLYCIDLQRLLNRKLFVGLQERVRMCGQVCVCLCVCVSISQTASTSVGVFVHLSVSLSTRPSVVLSV